MPTAINIIKRAGALMPTMLWWKIHIYILSQVLSNRSVNSCCFAAISGCTMLFWSRCSQSGILTWKGPLVKHMHTTHMLTCARAHAHTCKRTHTRTLQFNHTKPKPLLLHLQKQNNLTFKEADEQIILGFYPIFDILFKNIFSEGMGLSSSISIQIIGTSYL